MENSPYSLLKTKLSVLPARALNLSSRQILANNLDRKQLLLSEAGYPRDYRGLAELMNFNFCGIRKIEESNDRTLKILEAWEILPDATLDKLISYLESLDRFDVIEELIPFLEKCLEKYLEYQRLAGNPIQDAEISPGPINSHSERHAFSVHDLRTDENTLYDAYACYAEEDIQKVTEIAQELESTRVGLKLFIPARDMLAGFSELDADMDLIKNRCRHMLILLTQNFVRSPRLEFLVNFANSLNIEQRQRVLVPVILAPCEIPPILSSISKIDFTRTDIRGWLWDKLIVSLKSSDSMAFL